VNKLFNGEVALVTGGSSGIGRATALAFASEGARVVVSSRRSEESAETVRLIEAVGGDAFFVKTDVSKAAEVEAMVAQAIQRYGALSFAFNNAGIEGQRLVVGGAPLPAECLDEMRKRRDQNVEPVEVRLRWNWRSDLTDDEIGMRADGLQELLGAHAEILQIEHLRARVTDLREHNVQRRALWIGACSSAHRCCRDAQLAMTSIALHPARRMPAE